MRQTYIISVADPQCPFRPPERFHPKINRSGQRFLQPADGLTLCRWQLGESAHPKACQAAGSCELLLCLGARRNGGPIFAKQVRADWHFALVCLAQPSLASCQEQRWQVTRSMLVPGGDPTARSSPENGVCFFFFKSISGLKSLRCWMQLKQNHDCWPLKSSSFEDCSLYHKTFQSREEETWGLYTFLYWKLNTARLFYAY